MCALCLPSQPADRTGTGPHHSLPLSPARARPVPTPLNAVIEVGPGRGRTNTTARTTATIIARQRFIRRSSHGTDLRTPPGRVTGTTWRAPVAFLWWLPGVVVANLAGTLWHHGFHSKRFAPSSSPSHLSPASRRPSRPCNQRAERIHEQARERPPPPLATRRRRDSDTTHDRQRTPSFVEEHLVIASR